MNNPNKMSNDPIVQTFDVYKTYETKADQVEVLRGVNFSLTPGDMSFVIGRSGSGKSTFLHLLGCLDQCSYGKIMFEGDDVTTLPERKRDKIRNLRIGFVFQSYYLLPELTLYENVLLPALDRLEARCEVLAIDDGSTDGTGEALTALAQKERRLRVLFHPSNRGLGAALRTGLAEARGEWSVCLDADLTFSPELIGAMLAAQRESGADCVSGSPFLGGMPGVPLGRRLPSMLLNAFYRGLLDRRLTSFTPMFRLYRTVDLKKLPLACTGFEISAEIIALLLRAGRTVREIPAPLTVRATGASKLRRWRELANHLRLIGRLITA